jgi:uncharacterized membrane protein
MQTVINQFVWAVESKFMESIFILILLVVGGVPLVTGIWLIVKANQAQKNIEELSFRLSHIEAELVSLKQQNESAKPFELSPIRALDTARASKPASELEPTIPPPIEAVTAKLAFEQRSVIPPIPPMLATAAEQPEIEPMILPESKFNWEQFMGVKGFAWLGGFALFICATLFIKYSFDNNVIPPALRMAIGFLAGLGLLVGGVVMSRKNFPALSQTLCATGVLVLYTVTFACRSIYHFDFFGPGLTFLLLVLITTTAFLLAIRLDALVVAILGMLGGFLTPILLSTGKDNPLGLFGYIAILDIGLVFVALNRRWNFLPALSAFGTVVIQVGWIGKFFVSEKYFEGNKILIALAVLLGFNLVYLAANWWARKRDLTNQWLSGSSLGLAAIAFIFTGWFQTFAPLAQQPWLIFSFVLLIDLVAFALTLLDKKVLLAQYYIGFSAFVLLALWTEKSLSNELLNAALAFYFTFALVHSLLPVVLYRRWGIVRQNAPHYLFPILALILVMLPIFKLPEIAFIIWPFILLVDLLAIALAVLTTTVLPVLAVLLLTLAATGALIFKIPADLTGLPASFFLLGAFVVFFVVVGVWLVRKFKPDVLKSGITMGSDLAVPGDLAAILPASSIILPFLLLIMATARLPLINPSPVFGLALLLVVLLLGVTKLFSFDWMPAVGLVCVTALEYTWHFDRFDPTNTNLPQNLVLIWYLIFFAVFAFFPFLFLKQFSGKVVPWATAAMAALPQFFLVHRFIVAVYPNQFMGLLPTVFAMPALLSLVIILKTIPAENKSRLSQLAWFGGVGLFFITLIFPIQFDRQWITIGWALEGTALLWLFHRVPHRGVRLTGIGLLTAAFVRLAFNPAVLEYHARAATPIFNWYLYAYGLVTICLFVGTGLLAPPRHQVFNSNVPPILASLGTVLAFLLLNIEIADYFSTPGSTLTFQFRDNFARDMSYSIAWGSFALVLLVYGISKKSPAARYAAMGLLCVTLLKLFFHDLAQLGQLYRIGAFFCVAVIAMLASFAYQKFFNAAIKEPKSKNETPK